MFTIYHNFTCSNCKWPHRLSKRGNAELEEPMLPHGPRTMHYELEELPDNKMCYGVMKYIGFTAEPVRKRRMKNLVMPLCQRISPSKLNGDEAKLAADQLWQQLQGNEEVPHNEPVPDDLWRTVMDWYAERLQEIGNMKPNNAFKAMEKAIAKTLRTDCTISVAFNPALREYVTGYSGIQSGLWQRVGPLQVELKTPDPAVVPLEMELSKVQQRLSREVWVCAEVDAAVKALKKGWELGSLNFTAVEFKGDGWRQIQECLHCLQWAYK